MLDQSLGREDSLKEGMATYFSILAWRISWIHGLKGVVHHGKAAAYTSLLLGWGRLRSPPEGVGYLAEDGA